MNAPGNPHETGVIAEHFRALAEASHEFAIMTGDLDGLLDAVARRLGHTIGDMCAIRAITDDGEWLEATGAVFHRDPALLAATRELMASGRQRVGEGISGRVAATGRPEVTSGKPTADFVASTEPKYQSFLAQIAVTSSIALPLLCRGKVVGVANLMRSNPDQPYTADDFNFAQSLADHAALAIGNARSYAAERAARAAAEKATRALQAAEARFAFLANSGLVGIVVGTLDGQIVEANDTILELVGYSRDEILSGRIPWKGLTPPEWHAVDSRAVEQLATNGIGGLREKEFLRRDGTRVPVLMGSALLPGERRECISFVLDLTDRHDARREMERMQIRQASDAKFRDLLEAAPDAMVIAGEGGAIRIVNARAEALFGYARSELLGRPIEVLFPDRFSGSHSQPGVVEPGGAEPGRADVRRPGPRPMDVGLELLARRKDGTEFPIEVSSSPLETEEGVLVSSTIRDITERKRTEQQRTNLAAIVESSDDAIIGRTLQGVITSWNQGARRIFGYTADEMVGRSISLLVPLGLDDAARATLDAASRSEVIHFDTVGRRKDGREIDLSVTTSPVRNAAGDVVGISKVARDITNRKRAEEALAGAKEAAESASRELEAFSYSVAHDLRAPLRGMNGFAQILLTDYADKLDDEGKDCLQEIQGNAQKMGALIDALLSLSRVTRSDLHSERVDLSDLFRTVANQLSAAEPGRKVALVVEDHLSAEVDRRLARVLFDNLVGNAWKFTANRAEARIEFGAVEQQGTRTFFIRDNGAGFEMTHVKKLFGPFQRLHTVMEFPGTGIGLATVQRIIHRHGGKVWAEGKVGEGAVFHFTLPVQTAAAAQKTISPTTTTTTTTTTPHAAGRFDSRGDA